MANLETSFGDDIFRGNKSGSNSKGLYFVVQKLKTRAARAKKEIRGTVNSKELLLTS